MWRASLYTAFNIVASCSIVVANKVVLSTYKWRFPVALTCLHTIFTMLGMDLMAFCGFYTKKPLPGMQLLPLSLAYIGYVVLGNLSLQLNPVGLAQILKIAVVPSVILLELLLLGRRPTARVLSSVGLVCLGVAASTVTDSVAINNMLGLGMGMASTLVTAAYNVLCASKQKELQANSSQLLQACVMLAVLVPIMEPVGWTSAERGPDTLLGFNYSWGLVGALFLSSMLGVLVSLSAFLVIGATSSLTYNVVGNLKAVIIIGAGVALFGDNLSLERAAGVCIAIAGIFWYTQVASSPTAASAAKAAAGADVEGKLVKPAAAAQQHPHKGASSPSKGEKDSDADSKVPLLSSYSSISNPVHRAGDSAQDLHLKGLTKVFEEAAAPAPEVNLKDDAAGLQQQRQQQHDLPLAGGGVAAAEAAGIPATVASSVPDHNPMRRLSFEGPYMTAAAAYQQQAAPGSGPAAAPTAVLLPTMSSGPTGVSGTSWMGVDWQQFGWRPKANAE